MERPLLVFLGNATINISNFNKYTFNNEDENLGQI